MKRFALITLVVLCSIVSSAEAQNACKPQENKVKTTSSRYDSAVTQLTRLQERKDTRETQLELRLVQLNADVETAKADVKLVEKEAWGDGFGCLFQPRPNCIGNGFKNYFYRLGRAKKNLARAQAKLDGYVKSSQSQLARFQMQIEKQQQVVLQREADKIAAEEALKVCLAA